MKEGDGLGYIIRLVLLLALPVFWQSGLEANQLVYTMISLITAQSSITYIMTNFLKRISVQVETVIKKANKFHIF